MFFASLYGLEFICKYIYNLIFNYTKEDIF